MARVSARSNHPPVAVVRLEVPFDDVRDRMVSEVSPFQVDIDHCGETPLRLSRQAHQGNASG